jgi:plastocyanin
MKKTTRRHLLRTAAAGGVAAAGMGLTAIPRGVAASPATEGEHAHGQPELRLDGKQSSVTMTFGAWSSGPSPTDGSQLDRFKPPPPAPNRNIHVLQPNEVDIQPGGTVNFIISGLHLVLVYDDGTEMSDVDPTKLDATSTPPGFIDDTRNRKYRGLDPRVNPPDRVEVVHFAEPGRYFVTCGVVPHFNQGMNGYVNVKKRQD